jgi:hypothetical protein
MPLAPRRRRTSPATRRPLDRDRGVARHDGLGSSVIPRYWNSWCRMRSPVLRLDGVYLAGCRGRRRPPRPNAPTKRQRKEACRSDKRHVREPELKPSGWRTQEIKRSEHDGEEHEDNQTEEAQSNGSKEQPHFVIHEGCFDRSPECPASDSWVRPLSGMSDRASD